MAVMMVASTDEYSADKEAYFLAESMAESKDGNLADKSDKLAGKKVALMVMLARLMADSTALRLVASKDDKWDE
jgi:hypothetical protein